VNELKLLRALKDENRRLKHLVVDRALHIAMLKEPAGRKW